MGHSPIDSKRFRMFEFDSFNSPSLPLSPNLDIIMSSDIVFEQNQPIEQTTLASDALYGSVPHLCTCNLGQNASMTDDRLSQIVSFLSVLHRCDIMSTDPTREISALFIPDDSAPTQPITEVTVPFPPSSLEFNTVICQLLKCPERVAETLYSEDLLAVYEGNAKGFPPKQKFYVYDVYMDDAGNSTRSCNTRAAQLLLLSKSYGPMLIVKGVCVKDTEISELRVVDQEPLSERELASSSFQEKRRTFIEKQNAYKKRLFDLYQNEGFTVISS